MPRIAKILLIVLLAMPAAATAADIDWTSAPQTKITLFYPGTVSYEYLISPDHKLGGRKITQGKRNCAHCHLDSTGVFDLKTDGLVSGKARTKRSRKPFEPQPIPGKEGLLPAEVSAVYDDENVYIRVKWASLGTGWKKNASNIEILPDRVSLQLNKENDSFARYGCFITCHNDADSMPESAAPEEVSANAYYSALKRDTVRLYSFYTRTEGGGWADFKDETELKALRAAGGLIDIWSAELKHGEIKAHDGWLFEDRRWEDSSDVSAEAFWTSRGRAGPGIYSTFFKRKLKTGDARDVELKEGDVFSIALSIHDDNTEKRKHYASFPLTIGLGSSADLKAKKMK